MIALAVSGLVGALAGSALAIAGGVSDGVAVLAVATVCGLVGVILCAVLLAGALR